MQPDFDMDKEGAMCKERRNDIKINELRQTNGKKFNEQQPFPSIHKTFLCSFQSLT
jgi:hypothetical protein